MNIREAYDIILKDKYTYMAEQINSLNRKVTADYISNIGKQYDAIYNDFSVLGFSINNYTNLIANGKLSAAEKERDDTQFLLHRYEINSVEEAIAFFETLPVEFVAYVRDDVEEVEMESGKYALCDFIDCSFDFYTMFTGEW